MEEIKAGRFAVCKHPDHTDETDCGNRAIGCSKHCLCCMGEELAIELPEIKPTPGPWSVGGECKPVAKTTVYVQVEDIVFTIAHCDLSYVYFPNKANAKPLAHSHNIANARLIAAAPEMLAMLQEIATSGEWYASALELNDLCGYDIEKKLLELIAKATSN